MKRNILFLVLLLLPVLARADEFELSQYGFNFLVDTYVDPADASLDSYSGKLYGDVALPGAVYGFPVHIIWSYAFKNQTGMTSVSIPGNVVWVANNVFDGCTGIKSASIPSSVTNILDGAFQHCHSLLKVTIPGSVINIPPLIFYDCTSLTNVVIGNGVHVIQYQAFQNCTSLRSVAIPNSVTSMQSGAFYGCTSLGNVTIGNGLTFIGDSAFQDCISLTNITFGTSVNYIGAAAFYDCSNLTTITIPAGVSVIKKSTFYNCVNLKKVRVLGNVTNIESDAFNNCASLTNITFSGNAPTFSTKGDGLFDGVPTNAIVYYFYGTSGWGKTYDGLRTRQLLPPFFWQTNNLGNLSNAPSITITGASNVFASLVIPGDINGYPVISIGSQAFLNANMTNVVVPNTVTNVGNQAFKSCSNLTSLTFLGNAPVFGTNVFSGNPPGAAIYYLNGMTGWNASYGSLLTAQVSATPDGFQFTVNNNAANITGYSGAGGSAAIPGNIYGYPVTAINDYAFQGSALTSMTVPDSVASIGSYAFNNCYSLTNVTIGSGITNIGDYGFYNCPALTNIIFTGDAPAAGVNAFASVAPGAKVIHQYNGPLGQGGWDIFNVGLPVEVMVATTEDGFEYVTYNDEANIVGYSGAGGAVTIPDTIDDHPVSAIDWPQDGEGVTRLTVPASVVSIGDNSFTNDAYLTNITFLGNAPALGTNVFTGAAPGATVYYHSGTTGWGTNYGGLPTAELDAPFIYQPNPDGTLTIIGCSATNFVLNIPAFVYGSQPPQPVTGIGNSAFHDITSLMDAVIPGSITNIGDGAFTGCINLTNIIFLGDAPASGTGVFVNVGSGATVYYLPGTSGWGPTFDGLPTVMITTTPDGFGFTLNEDNSVTITNYTGVGGTVTIPDIIYDHPVSAIDWPNDGVDVTSLTIPASVISIGDNSFNNWSALTNITFLGNAPALGTNVFNGLGAGATVYYYYGTTGWGATYGGLPTIALNGPAVAATFSVPTFISNQFQFTINGTGGSNYVVQATTNLTTTNWISLATNVAPFQFTETNAGSFGKRFYRVKVWP